jgi:hypothetical protein
MQTGGWRTRQVHIAGIIPEPDGLWMKQVARNLTDGIPPSGRALP